MKRVSKKSVSAVLALIMLLIFVSPVIKVYAYDNGNYRLTGLTSIGYSDGVKFGQGYLLLKNGKFNNINPDTTYTYVDSKGNMREIKNTVGFTQIYLNTSGSTYYVDYGALAVGKDGKVGIMDLQGNMYGGNTNFYQCVIHAGDNLFYTTDATKDQQDKGNTTVWTLRRKDGSVVKEFQDLDFMQDRVHSNGYEYISYTNNGVRELICVDPSGNVKLMGTGYEGYTVYSDYGYVVGYKNDNNTSWNEYTRDIFKENGEKLFTVEKSTDIDIEGLYKYGYARVSSNYNGKATQNLIDSKGNYIFDIGKYETISGYDDKQATVIDYNQKIFLMDYNKNTIFNGDEFVKKFGESYKAVTASSYYIDSTLTLTIKDVNKANDIGTSFFFDKSGNEISGNISGTINTFNGTYAGLYDSSASSYGVVKKDNTFHKDGYNILRVQDDPNESDVVAIADKGLGSKILLMKNGTDIDKYDELNGFGYWVSLMYINGHAMVRKKGTNEYGIIDIHGNEIIATGEYNRFKLYNESRVILGYKDDKPYLFDENGKVLNEQGKYANIGDYKTEFYSFPAGNNATEYIDNITSNNVTIVGDFNGNIGLVRVINASYDLNNDGIIDIQDIANLAKMYNVKSTDVGWNNNLDFNNDNTIDIYDLVLISKEM